ncbi:isochorismatase family protein [Silvibacterium dinghuense]|uniref:Isochorismatase family protein n=1 Tax=Silvibacterium dinghuense TaxID=1560006 RepID=A0A4Q1SHP3_9BACT|nr:isochorismatase family protein [Silvibacterium dinghuense]RXS96895.1 isochorismatase family protein [Silvibacterium dinghuense]GGG94500.1 hydrolase [Silvibacterium dinghuense]
MPLTQLEPNAALIIIDLQKGITAMPVSHPVSDVIQRSAELARAFRERGLPVVLVNVAGAAPGRTSRPRPDFSQFPADFAELVPELDAQPTDHRVTKHAFGAFPGTGLDDYLRSRGVTQIVLTGVATTIGVESTARSAYDHGYHIVFVSDAMADLSAAAHTHSIENIFPRMGEIDTTETVLARLRA